MSMMEAVRTVFSKYAQFSGRSRRSEYWWFALFNGIIGLVLYLLFIGGAAASKTVYDEYGRAVSTNASPLLWLGAGLLGLWSLATFLPSLAVFVRRMHDTGRSGWWYFLALVPFGGFVLMAFAAMDGTPGPNQYGPDPKGRDQMYGGYAAPVDQAGAGQYGAAPYGAVSGEQQGYGQQQYGQQQYGQTYGQPQPGQGPGASAAGDNPFATPDDRA